jgi:hypothetical protein
LEVVRGFLFRKVSKWPYETPGRTGQVLDYLEICICGSFEEDKPFVIMAQKRCPTATLHSLRPKVCRHTQLVWAD